MSNIPTPHITAALGDFADTVLMPGDPLRSKFIAENFLENPVLVNNIRGVQGYTGTYKGKRVSVMASGMGMPAIGIYSHELFNFYDVKNIIRIGSAGGLQPDIKVGDIVIAQGCSTFTKWADQYELPGTYAPLGSYELIKKAEAEANKLGIKPHIGNVFCSDVFYANTEEQKKLVKMGVLAAEMESAALYMEAAAAGKNALCICTISDHIFTGEGMSAEARETTFTNMMEIALNIA